jgi:hypothetical protein
MSAFALSCLRSLTDNQYWQKVSGLKEKLALLERVPEPTINRAA